MRRNITLALTGFTLFFLVMTVLYTILVFTQSEPQRLIPFFPLIVFSGFFIFLIGAILLALSISKIIDKRYPSK